MVGPNNNSGNPPGNNSGNSPGTGPTRASRGRAQLGRYLERLDRMRQEEESGIQVPEGGFTDIGNVGLNRLKELNVATRELAKAGRVFARGGAVEASLQDSIAALDTFLGSSKLAKLALSSMSQELEGLDQIAKLSTGASKEVKNLLGDLTTQAAALRQLGLSHSEFNRNIELGTNVLGLQSDQIRALNSNIVDFANEVKLLPSVVSQNFRLVAESMAYEGPKLVEQFQKMQKLSAQTGVSVGTLATGFGEGMDTISGAAGFAAKLNAILGYQAISPNELLMMDDADRAIRIRELIRNHPIYNEIFQGTNPALSKFALQTISKNLGMSRADTRRFLRGAPPGQGGTANEADQRSLKSKIAQEFGKDFSAATTDLLKGISSFGNKFEQLADRIVKQQLDPLDQARMQERRGMLRRLDTGAEPTLGTMTALATTRINEFGRDFTRQFGVSSLSEGQIDRLTVRFPEINQIARILQTFPSQSQARRDLQQKFNRLLTGAQSAQNPRQIRQIKDEMAELLMESQTQLRSNQAGDNRDFRQLSPAEMSLIKRTTKMLGAQRRLFAQLRGMGVGANPLEQEVRMDGQTMTLEQYIDGINLPDSEKERLKKNIREQGTAGGGLQQRQQVLNFFDDLTNPAQKPEQKNKTKPKSEQQGASIDRRRSTPEDTVSDFVYYAGKGRIKIQQRFDFTKGRFVETVGELILEG